MRIDKVITVLLKFDEMEKLNKLTGMNNYTAENWCDKTTILECDLRKFLTIEQFNAIYNGRADFVAFRLDN